MTPLELTNRMESITTIRELFDFRNELLQIQDANSSVGRSDLDFHRMGICQNAHYYQGLCEKRIADLNEKGVYLDKIVVTKEEKPVCQTT